MKKLLLSLLFISIFPIPVYATKGGLLTDDASVLGVPKDAVDNGTIPSPKKNVGIEDLTIPLDRTNQDMNLTSLNATQAVFDDSDPFANTLISNYVPNKIIKVRVREFMGTLIVLPDGDSIRMWKLGDQGNFSFKPSITVSDDVLPQSGQVDITLAGADTALHIIGMSGNIYSFYLRGDTWNSPHNPTMKVILKDDQLLAKIEADERRKKAKHKLNFSDLPEEKVKDDYLETVGFDPSSMDFDYRIIGGDEEIRPYMVWSDGQFTYFRYAKSESVADVKSFPSIYRVADGSDVPTNVSPMGSTLRVEGVANNWTLRLGKSWLCIEKIQRIPDTESSMNVVNSTEE